jgi:6-phosphogluconolactonase
MEPEIRVLHTADDVAREAASAFVRLANEAVRSSGRFAVALSGGSTPKALFSLLAGDASLRSQMPWDRTHFFWGDERHVPPDHADSNYRMANEAMLSKVPVPAANVHRIKSELADAHQAAAEYEQTLRDFFSLGAGRFPRFDLVLLGMGPDGHTASLFPGTDALREETRLVVANWVPKFDTFRITLTLPVLNNAAWVLFLVSGAEKAPVLRGVLGSESGPEKYPSQLVRPAKGRLIWLVSEDAAGRLERTA